MKIDLLYFLELPNSGKSRTNWAQVRRYKWLWYLTNGAYKIIHFFAICKYFLWTKQASKAQGCHAVAFLISGKERQREWKSKKKCVIHWSTENVIFQKMLKNWIFSKLVYDAGIKEESVAKSNQNFLVEGALDFSLHSMFCIPKNTMIWRI